jgi:glycosyltransferase involved in cell wall biosynthesis
MEFRPYYLAREWVRAGHAVQMISASFSHVRSKQPTAGGASISAPTTEWIDGIEYCWQPTPHYSGNGVRRVLNIWAFLRPLWWRAQAIASSFKPDIVIASSTYPMDIWVARRIARLSRAKLVFEVHDLWPLSPIELGGMSPGHPFIRLCQWSEDAAYRDADVVVSMLPRVAEHMQSHGLDLRRLHVVPNGISPDDWSGPVTALQPDIERFIEGERSQGRVVVGYAGSHGVPNALDYLLDAAALMRDDPVSFVLVGDGMEKARLAARVASDGLSRVRMFAPIPKAQVPAFLQQIDIAYIGWLRSSIYRFGIAPNKLLDYMMAARPVLHSVEAGNDPVAESGCGVTVAPEAPTAIAEGLRRVASMNPEQRREMGERGCSFVTAYHTYPVLARGFLEACA